MTGSIRSRLRALNQSGPFWNMMGSGMLAANTVILTMLVGNFSDLATVGVFTLALTTSQILYSLGLFGANDLQMTDYGHAYRFGNYFHVKVFSTLVAVICCIAAVFILRFSAQMRLYTYLLTGFMMVNSIAELYQAMFFQNNRLDLSGKAVFYRYLVSTLAFFAALLAGGGIAAACVAMLVTDIAATLWWDLRLAGRFRDSGYRFEKEPCLRLMRAAFPLCLSVLSNLIVVNCPKYIIDATLSDEIQGMYGIMFMPTYAINLVSTFIYRPYFSKYADLLHHNRRGFWRLMLTQAGLIGALTAAGAGAIWLLGVPLLRLLFGQDLSGRQGLMALFMLSGGILAVSQLLYYIMVILRRQKTVLAVYLVSMALTITAGLILIPRLGLLGAWASFTVGQLVLAAGFAAVLCGCLKKMDVGAPAKADAE